MRAARPWGQRAAAASPPTRPPSQLSPGPWCCAWRPAGTRARGRPAGCSWPKTCSSRLAQVGGRAADGSAGACGIPVPCPPLAGHTGQAAARPRRNAAAARARTLCHAQRWQAEEAGVAPALAQPPLQLVVVDVQEAQGGPLAGAGVGQRAAAPRRVGQRASGGVVTGLLVARQQPACAQPTPGSSGLHPIPAPHLSRLPPSSTKVRLGYAASPEGKGPASCGLDTLRRAGGALGGGEWVAGCGAGRALLGFASVASMPHPPKRLARPAAAAAAPEVAERRAHAAHRVALQPARGQRGERVALQVQAVQRGVPRQALGHRPGQLVERLRGVGVGERAVRRSARGQRHGSGAALPLCAHKTKLQPRRHTKLARSRPVSLWLAKAGSGPDSELLDCGPGARGRGQRQRTCEKKGRRWWAARPASRTPRCCLFAPHPRTMSSTVRAGAAASDCGMRPVSAFCNGEGD